MYMYEAVADRINEIRKDQNMSIRQLSSVSRVPYSTLYAIIMKKTKAIKIATLGNIISIFLSIRHSLRILKISN